MRWSILVLTMPRRREMLGRLLGVLVPQLEPHRDDVELLVNTSDPEWHVGENREILRRQARGRYISFIDDDDMVAEDYVSKIYPCLDGVHYVGFNVEQTFDGKPRSGCVERHSLQYNGVWFDHSGSYDGHFRDISHLNPMLKDIATIVPMSGWPGEDSRWADELRTRRVLRTEHYIDEVLYHYMTRTVKPELEAVGA